MDNITLELKKHYSQSFKQYGPTPKGVDWGEKEDVSLRYHKMISVIGEERQKDSISLLDVGCGYGGLLQYMYTNSIPDRDINILYTGIDVVESMIDYAKANFKEANFIHGDIFDLDTKETFDYVICNGILTQKLSASTMDMDKFAHKLIKKMYALCNVGVVFNIMTSKVNYTVSNLYYRNPGDLFIYCMNEITSKLKIDHAYPLFEYTMYLYKE